MLFPEIIYSYTVRHHYPNSLHYVNLIGVLVVGGHGEQLPDKDGDEDDELDEGQSIPRY